MSNMRVAAAILSGGNSQRMGFDKQLITIDGLLLRDYQSQILNSLFNEVIVVTQHPSLYDHSVKCVKDLLPYSCPLTGIYSALSETKYDAVFVIACDMPIIDIDLIKLMSDEFEDKNPDVCIPFYGDYFEPLYGFYSKRCQATIKQYLEKGERKIRTFYDEINLLPYYAENTSTFINLNEPSDLLKLEVKNGIIVQKENS